MAAPEPSDFVATPVVPTISAAVHAKRWWTLATLCVSLTVIGIDNTILNVAIPSIVRETGAAGSQIQWMVDGYSIVFACLLLTAGSVGDKYGRKRALSFGLVVFGAGSLCAALTTSPALLIGTRSVMGIGGAFIYPTTLSILTNTFVGRERARAIGIWAGVSGIGIALGPLLGGFLLEHYWWGSVFLINVPVCIAALILGRFYIFDSKDPSGKKLDVVGATLSIIGLVGVLYAVIEAPDSGWGAPNVIGGFVFGAIFLALFARWELRSSHPMLELRFFRNPRFSAASMTMTLIYFALFGTTFLLTQYFQFVLGYSPLKSGFMTAAVAIGLMIAAPLAPRFVDSFGTKIVVMAGLLIAGLCMLAYTSQSVLDSLVGGWLVRMAYGAGIGLIAAPVTESIMGALPPAQAGVGSAVNDTTRQTGGALGVAILGSIVAAKYHALIDAGRATIPPASYAKVHDSIGRAVDAASRLAKSDAAAAQRVLHLSFNAFFKASQIAYLVGTGIVVLAMFICGRYLPKEAEPIEDIAIADAIEPMIE